MEVHRGKGERETKQEGMNGILRYGPRIEPEEG